MDNNNGNTNILPNLKTQNTFFPLIGLLVILIVIMFLLFFKVSLPTSVKSTSKSQEEITANILIVTFFVLIVFGLCITLLPNFKSIKELFQQISSVTYVILYTILLIVFFTTIITYYYTFIIPYKV